MLPLHDVNPRHRLPIVTLLIVLANVVVFLLVQPSTFRELVPTPGASRSQVVFLYEHAIVPCEITNWDQLSPELQEECTGQAVAQAPVDEAYFPGKNLALSLLASMFFHANWLHLLGNMWFLWVFGDNVEDRVGRFRFLLLYLAGGLVASFGHIVTQPQSVVPVIGASGAVAAALGAYLVLFPRRRVVAIVPPLFFLPLVVRAWFLLVVWFVLQFFTAPEAGVAWVAHVVGFAFGFVAVLPARALGGGQPAPQRPPEPPRPRRRRPRGRW